MDLTFNLAPSYRDSKDPTTRQNFEDTVEQKRVIDLRACHIHDHHHDSQGHAGKKDSIDVLQ